MGTAILNCRFRNQSDDGVNSMRRGEFVNATDGTDALVHHAVGTGRTGELVLLVDPVTGQYRGNLFVRERRGNFKWRDGFAARTVFNREVPRDVQTYVSLGLGTISRKDEGLVAMNLKKIDLVPDHIYAPSADDVGTLVCGCDIRNMRGSGTVIQGANSLIEDNTYSNIWRAVNLGGLVKNEEGPPPYNERVRGNRIADVETGIESRFMVLNRGPAGTAAMRGVDIESNVVERASFKPYLLKNLE